MDCMEALKEYPDGYFDLALVDPPYGDGSGDSGGVQPVWRMVRAVPADGSGTDSARDSVDTPRRGG